MMETQDAIRDPYRRCEERCRHDLGRGLSIAELLGDEPAPAQPIPPLPSLLSGSRLEPVTAGV